MYIKDSLDMIFDKVKDNEEVEIDYDDEIEEMIVQTSTPLQETSENHLKWSGCISLGLSICLHLLRKNPVKTPN